MGDQIKFLKIQQKYQNKSLKIVNDCRRFTLQIVDDSLFKS